MRDGRRNRLGLANGTEPELFSDLVSTTTPVVDNAAIADTSYLNRILTDADVAGEPNILSLDSDANVRTTDQRYVQDAYNYYLGGGTGDFADEVALTGGETIPGAINTLVSGDGQNLATSGLDLGAGTTPDTTIRDQLIDKGIQAAEDDKGDMMLDTTPSFDDQYLEIEDIPITQSDQGVSVGEAYPPIDLDQGVSVGEAYPPIDTVDYSEFDDLEADIGAQPIEGLDTEPSLIDIGRDKIDSIGQSISNTLGTAYDAFNTTVEIAGKKINLASTAAKTILNKLAGGPVSLIIDALGAMKPDKYNKEAVGSLGEIDMLKTTEGGLTTDKYGINVESAFGDYDDYNLERQIDLQEKIDAGTLKEFNEDGTLTYLGKELEDRKTIEKQLNETRLEEAGQEQQDFVQEIQDQTPVQSGSDAARDQQRDTGVATVKTDYGTRYVSSGGTFASAEEAAEKGEGGSSGGKIVCTMMNESYGFGSFRNKIWLKHSKDLAPEYQIGYHKIFLPLVKLSKKNIVLKKVLEHIAVHRTIDIRQEARGKVHLLGRIYRKILEPICYIVGKNAKR